MSSAASETTRPVCIVPARGGSRRLPRKNILPVSGRPMITHVVAAALASGVYESVVVSTEDDEIARIARESGAQTSVRPDDLATDAATVTGVCHHVLQEMGQKAPAVFCCIYPTAIFVTPDDHRSSFELTGIKPLAHFVLGVSSYNLPPVLALEVGDEFAHYRWPEFQELKSQQQPTLFAANGTLHWARTAAFRDEKTLVGSRLRLFELPLWRTIDIDTPDDYAHAQLLAQKYLA